MARRIPPERRYPSVVSVDPSNPSAPNLIPSKPKPKPKPKPKRTY